MGSSPYHFEQPRLPTLTTAHAYSFGHAASKAMKKKSPGGDPPGLPIAFKDHFFAWRANRLLNLSTRPAVSTSIILPV